MAATVNQATENNQKLFRQYTKKLSQDDTSVYASHADKLGRWLSDEKAYYKSARPEIVKLLLTAQSTLKRNVGAEPNPMSPFNATLYLDHPMADPYIRLIHSVKPYTHLFVEPDLRIFVGRIVQSASAELVTERTSAGLPSASVPSELHIPQMPSVTASCISSRSDAWTSPANFAAIDAQHNDFQNVSGSSVSASFSSFMTESRLSRPPLGSELSLAVSTPEVMAPSKLDFENTATIKTQGSAPLSVDNGSISVPISKPKTKRKSRLDLSALLKKDVVALQQKKLEASSGTVPPLYNLRSDVTSVKTEPTDSLVSHSEKVDLNVHNSTTPKQPMHSMTMPQPFQNATKLPEIIDLTMDDLDVEIYSAPVIQQEAEVKMDVDVEQDHYMDIGSGAVAYNVHDHTDIQPIAIEDGYKADVSTIFDTTNPDTIVTRSIPESSTKSLFPEENNVAGNDSVPFGSQMKVIAIQNGLENASKISIRFEMPDTLFSQLSKWVHRHFDTQSLQNSLCLSLACYSSSEILERINEGIHHSQEELVSSLQSFWPTSGGLSMSMPLTQAVEEFPLSPPFMVTQDGFVDVSQFVSVGQNAIELSHQTELSNHTFVLYVHNPTQSQLQQITEQRDNEQQWETWAQHISRPFAES